MTFGKFREALQKMPRAGEFALVITLCFGYSIVTSIRAFFLDAQVESLGGLALVRWTLFKIARLSVASYILTVRGWDLHQLGFRFSWLGILAGVPVWLGYLCLYVAAFFLALFYYPLAIDPHSNFFLEGSTAVLLVAILINSIFEETVVTGYVVGALSTYGVVISIAASALIRLSYHLFYGPATFVFILPMGLVFPLV